MWSNRHAQEHRATSQTFPDYVPPSLTHPVCVKSSIAAQSSSKASGVCRASELQLHVENEGRRLPQRCRWQADGWCRQWSAPCQPHCAQPLSRCLLPWHPGLHRSVDKHSVSEVHVMGPVQGSVRGSDLLFHPHPACISEGTARHALRRGLGSSKVALFCEVGTSHPPSPSSRGCLH